MMKSISNQGRVRSRCWEGVSERWRGVRGGGGVWYAGYLCGRRGGGWKVVVYGGETGYPRKDQGTEGWWAWVRGVAWLGQLRKGLAEVERVEGV